MLNFLQKARSWPFVDAQFLTKGPLPLGSLEPTEFTEVDFSFYFRLRGPEVKNNRPPGESHAGILSDL